MGDCSEPCPLWLSPAAAAYTHTLSLHDALPIFEHHLAASEARMTEQGRVMPGVTELLPRLDETAGVVQSLLTGNLAGNRSEEHTSELQSRRDLVCRLLLENKKRNGSPAALYLRY